MNYTVTYNKQFNSSEITFDAKPSAAVRDALKALRFRWHHVRGVWYGYADADEIAKAIRAAENGNTAPTPKTPKTAPKTTPKTTPKTAKPAPVNKYGVKVGDLFECSWGYDQTQNDFYQVVALCGSTSVRVREVTPELLRVENQTWGSEDRVFSTNTHGKMLPPVEHSLFIKDQKNGDMKRLKSYYADGVSHPQFTVTSYADAYLCSSDTVRASETWYR